LGVEQLEGFEVRREKGFNPANEQTFPMELRLRVEEGRDLMRIVEVK